MARTIPIIRLYDNILVSIQIELSDKLVSELQDGICLEIQESHPKGLILEVSGVDILDSYIARSLRDLTQMARLMGVRSVIAGLDPSMAVTLVEMGLTFSDVPTALNLEMAMETLQQVLEDDEEESVEEREAFDILEGF